ncbi:MAG: hypothetical protein ACRDYC_03880, partial [Acidimicrobiales bacterium]
MALGAATTDADNERLRRAPWRTALARLGLGALTLAGCAYPAGDPQALSSVDFPDPAAVVDQVAPASAQLYGTGTAANGANIITEQWKIGTTSVSSLGDALPSPGYPVVPGLDWAPTVRYIDGQYVMWFSAAVTTNLTHCLMEAVSSTASGPFHTVGTPYCDQDFLTLGLPLSDGANVGLLDPSLFFDPLLHNWVMLWSRQWAPGGGSEIADLIMNPDGSIPLLRIPTVAASYNEVVQALAAGGQSPSLGVAPTSRTPRWCSTPPPTRCPRSSSPPRWALTTNPVTSTPSAWRAGSARW